MSDGEESVDEAEGGRNYAHFSLDGDVDHGDHELFGGVDIGRWIIVNRTVLRWYRKKWKEDDGEETIALAEYKDKATWQFRQDLFIVKRGKEVFMTQLSKPHTLFFACRNRGFAVKIDSSLTATCIERAVNSDLGWWMGKVEEEEETTDVYMKECGDTAAISLVDPSGFFLTSGQFIEPLEENKMLLLSSNFVIRAAISQRYPNEGNLAVELYNIGHQRVVQSFFYKDTPKYPRHAKTLPFRLHDDLLIAFHAGFFIFSNMSTGRSHRFPTNIKYIQGAEYGVIGSEESDSLVVNILVTPPGATATSRYSSSFDVEYLRSRTGDEISYLNLRWKQNQKEIKQQATRLKNFAAHLGRDKYTAMLPHLNSYERVLENFAPVGREAKKSPEVVMEDIHKLLQLKKEIEAFFGPLTEMEKMYTDAKQLEEVKQ